MCFIEENIVHVKYINVSLFSYKKEVELTIQSTRGALTLKIKNYPLFIQIYRDKNQKTKI